MQDLQTLTQALNGFDITFLIASALAVVLACRRGLGGELLHTLIFLMAMVGGTIFMAQTNPHAGEANESTQAAFLSINLAYYALAAFLATSVLLKVLSPLMMKTITDVGLRSRLWAGLICTTKIIATSIFLLLWYAIHAPEPHPTRLLALPNLLQNSYLVQLADGGWTQSTHFYLADKGVLPPPILPPEQQLLQDEQQPTTDTPPLTTGG